jgi:hypothetical protein
MDEHRMPQVPVEILRSAGPLITDRESLRGYCEMGYTLVEARPYWMIYEPDGTFYGLVDRGVAESEQLATARLAEQP